MMEVISQNTVYIFMLRVETYTEDCRYDFILLLSSGSQAKFYDQGREDCKTNRMSASSVAGC